MKEFEEYKEVTLQAIELDRQDITLQKEQLQLDKVNFEAEKA